MAKKELLSLKDELNNITCYSTQVEGEIIQAKRAVTQLTKQVAEAQAEVLRLRQSGSQPHNRTCNNQQSPTPHPKSESHLNQKLASHQAIQEIDQMNSKSTNEKIVKEANQKISKGFNKKLGKVTNKKSAKISNQVTGTAIKKKEKSQKSFKKFFY